MKIKPRDFTILFILIGALLVLQSFSNVLSDVNLDILGLSTEPYTLKNDCYDAIIFETVDGEEWMRVRHDTRRSFTPDVDFQMRREDGEPMAVDVDGVRMTGRTIAIQLDSYEQDVVITTCAE